MSRSLLAKGSTSLGQIADRGQSTATVYMRAAEDVARVSNGPGAVRRRAAAANVAQPELFEFNSVFITIERCRIVTTQSCRSVCKHLRR
jgi:hypothetical protein